MKKIPAFKNLRQWRTLAGILAIVTAIESAPVPAQALLPQVCKTMLRGAFQGFMGHLPFADRVSKITEKVSYQQLDYKAVDKYIETFQSDPYKAHERFDDLRAGRISTGVSETFALAIFESDSPLATTMWNGLLPDQILWKYRLLPGIGRGQRTEATVDGDGLLSTKYKATLPRVEWQRFFSDPAVFNQYMLSVVMVIAKAYNFAEVRGDLKTGPITDRVVRSAKGVAFKMYGKKLALIKAFGLFNKKIFVEYILRLGKNARPVGTLLTEAMTEAFNPTPEQQKLFGIITRSQMWSVFSDFLWKIIPIGIGAGYWFRLQMQRSGGGAPFVGVFTVRSINDDKCKPEDEDLKILKAQFDPNFKPEKRSDGTYPLFDESWLPSPDDDEFIGPRQDPGNVGKDNPCDPKDAKHPHGIVKAFFDQKKAEFHMTDKSTNDEDMAYVHWYHDNKAARDENGMLIEKPKDIDIMRAYILKQYETSQDCRNYYSWFKRCSKKGL